MRKLSALAMVALLALTLAIAVLGCGKKEEASTESMGSTTTPAESTATGGMDTTSMGHDSTMAK